MDQDSPPLKWRELRDNPHFRALFLSKDCELKRRQKLKQLVDPTRGARDPYEIGVARGWLDCFSFIRSLPAKKVEQLEARLEKENGMGDVEASRLVSSLRAAVGRVIRPEGDDPVPADN